MVEKFFWADAIADKIIKEKGKKTIYVCASGITPSGHIHIGNFREIITTELVVRALKDKCHKVRFIYSWDDYDRFRKVPLGLPNREKFERYIGMPVSEVPNPFGKKYNAKTYAEFFEKELEKSLKEVGIKPNFIYQSKMHKSRKYAKLIKIALDKKETIRKILDNYRKEPLEKDWLPIIVYCEKCKKDTTKITNVRETIVEYVCKCGFKGKINYTKKPGVKLQWRVDWPARWFYERVDFEPGGADHSAPGGSFDTGKQISKEVYSYEAPLYQLYEWIKIKGGKEFAGSSGNALTLADVSMVYEPEVLRYLFVGTRPNKGFAISFDNDVIKIYEDFDTLEEKYFNKQVNPQEKRIYELSQTRNIPGKNPEKTSFRHLITLVQIGKKKYIKKQDKVRAEKVKNWLDKHAGEDMKFSLEEEINVKLSEKEKQALIELREFLKNKKLNEEKLFNEFYSICQKTGIKNTEFFEAAYKAIIGKKKGPRLASLILVVGKDKIIKLLNQIK